MENQKVKRLFSLDVFRIICAGMVFLFHSRIHIGINYGIFNNYIGMGHIFMVAFFMLSGFSLFYVDNERGNLNENSFYPNIWSFIKKRIVSLCPGYLGLYAVHTLVSIFYYKNFNIKEFVIGLPMELGLFQSALIGSFGYLHNGGTWFISCIFICYVFYPYAASLIAGNTKKNNLMLFVLLYCISSYAFLPAYKLDFSSIYANPLLRFVEFVIGILIAKFFIENRELKLSLLCWIFVILAFVILFCALSVKVHFLSLSVEKYNFIAIPCFGCILYFSARVEMVYGFKCCRKLISMFSENTYAFFLAQFFSWIPVNYLISNSQFLESYSDLKKLLVSLIWTCIVTAFFHYGIEKSCKKILWERRAKN